MIGARMPAPAVFPPEPLEGYALLDFGHGEKLEQFGPYVLRRPDPQAMVSPRLDPSLWQQRSHLAFLRESDRGGRWEAGGAAGRAPESWELALRGAKLLVRPTPFKHVGLFPEQASNWSFTARALAALGSAPLAVAAGERPRVLNLFAYTGAATVFAARAGAFVTHVDSSRPALRWAKENATLSGLPGDAVRWIEDDALAFLRREQRRGRSYHGVLLDPPPYGRGPNGEKWVFEEQIVELVAALAPLLDARAAFVVLSCYAVGTSPLAFANLLGELGPGTVEAGELALAESAATPRLLPAGLCARWQRLPGTGTTA